MNEGGDFDKLGRGHVWHGQIDPCIHQNHVFAVRPHGVSPEVQNNPMDQAMRANLPGRRCRRCLAR